MCDFLKQYQYYLLYQCNIIMQCALKIIINVFQTERKI